MLHEFLTSNRKELIKRCRGKASKRSGPTAIPAEMSDHGVPLFLQQLVDSLRLEETPATDADVSAPESTPAPTEIGRTAALHGAEMLRRGFTVDQVVHEYGDVCQSVTELAAERNTVIATREFRALNGCLDNAIADAVTAFGEGRQSSMTSQAETLQERLNAFADDHHRLVDIAIQSFSAIKTGNIGPTGATGALLAHALTELRDLAERLRREVPAPNR